MGADAREPERESAVDPALERTILHVDMDAFFASCEALEDPSLRGDVVFAVGGQSMISTASYAARRYGVRSAMPGFIAQRLCREAGEIGRAHV